MKKLLILVTVLLINLEVYAGTIYYEKEYQKVWCQNHNGQTEVILPDKARVDCVTENYAIEFDFAKKWGESIGQALYYALILNKKAGIVLIMENGNNDTGYLARVNKVAKSHNITVWTMTPEDMKYSGIKPHKRY